jgi:hypothetical protein
MESEYPVLNALNGADVNVDELDFLAKRLDSFGDREAVQFNGAAYVSKVKSIEDFINMTFCFDTVTVVSDFKDLKSIGRQHYMDKKGGAVPLSELDGVDFEQEALELLQSGKGIVTPFGVVYDNGMELEQLYQGREFPTYFYDSPIAALWLTHESEPDRTPTFLPLPMPKICLERALERGDWNQDLGDMKVEFHAFAVPQELFERIQPESEKPHQLNELAWAIATIDESDCAKFRAATEMVKADDVESLEIVARHLADFLVYGEVRDVESFGKKVFYTHYGFEKQLEDYFDFARFGQDILDAEGGVFTDYGYISYDGEFPIEELMKRKNQQELKTLNLYMPLSAHMYEHNEWGDYENEPTELSSREILQFQDNIFAALMRENQRDETERGLMEYYKKNDGVNEKVHSLCFGVAQVGFELFGVAECKVSKDLTQDEMDSLKDYVIGQASDGFGESLEQREIKDSEGNEIYVSLWSSEKSWSLMTREELSQRQEMGGMRFGQ